MNTLRLFKLSGFAIPVGLCAIAVGLCAPVHGQTTQTMSITCTSSGQVCTPDYSIVINVPQPGAMTLNYTPPQTA